MNNTIKFGTDGIRGRADKFPFTPDALKKLGKALYTWALTQYPNRSTINILIASDTRQSCAPIKKALCDGLLTYATTIVDAGVLSTPAACSFMQRDSTFDLGIVISASHNPYYDNGIKIFIAGGGKLSPSDESAVITYFNAIKETHGHEPILGTLYQKDLMPRYQEHINTLFKPNFLQGLTIALDCANGATSAMAPAIFAHFGATVIPLATTPNGTNINDNCGSLHPENLQQEVVIHKTFAGFAFDGDGDRIIAVNHQGELRDGDDIVWLLAHSDRYQHLSTIVGTIMANSGFEQALKIKEKTLIRVDVGDKHILKKLNECNLLLGGEPSGHIIMGDYLPICDGIVVALRLLEIMLTTNNITMTTFTHFPQVLLNIPITEKKDLATGACASIIASYQDALPEGRILVRYSGTENVLRIMTEAPNSEYAQTIAQQLGTDLTSLLT